MCWGLLFLAMGSDSFLHKALSVSLSGYQCQPFSSSPLDLLSPAPRLLTLPPEHRTLCPILPASSSSCISESPCPAST